jgi:hypothetical protein
MRRISCEGDVLAGAITMKCISLAILPFIVAAGACSSSNSSQGQSTYHDAGNTDGATATSDAGEAGTDDSSTPTGDTGTPGTEYDAVLSGTQVAPTVVQTTATGTGQFLLQPDGQTMNYTITQNVPNATAVNVHIGPVGKVGSTVTHMLTPVSGHMTGSFTLTSNEVTALPLDQLYVDVQSQANMGGEVRGQIVPPNAQIFVAYPTGAQEVPAVASTYTALGGFVVTWNPSSSTGSLVYHVETTATPTGVALHRGIGSSNGMVAYTLPNTAASMDGSQALSGSDNTDVTAGHLYLNIITAANQAGELRGQIIPVGATLFTGALASTNEVPPVTSMATGSSQFILSADQKKLNYEAIVNGILPGDAVTGAELDTGAMGATGTVLYQLTLNQTGALGSTAVTASDVQQLLPGNTYINFKTSTFANGELRAQLAKQ